MLLDFLETYILDRMASLIVTADILLPHGLCAMCQLLRPTFIYLLPLLTGSEATKTS